MSLTISKSDINIARSEIHGGNSSGLIISEIFLPACFVSISSFLLAAWF